MSDIDEKIVNLKRLLEKASPRPWSVGHCNSGEACWCRVIQCPEYSPIEDKPELKQSYVVPDGAVGRDDAVLLTEIVNTFPELLSELEWRKIRAEEAEALVAGLKKPLLQISKEEADRMRALPDKDRDHVAVPVEKWHEILCSECSGWDRITDELEQAKKERDEALTASRSVPKFGEVCARCEELERYAELTDELADKEMELRRRVLSLSCKQHGALLSIKDIVEKAIGSLGYPETVAGLLQEIQDVTNTGLEDSDPRSIVDP